MWYAMRKHIYSCPGVYVLGSYREDTVVGYASFPILQYRSVVVKDDQGFKCWSRVPWVFGGDVVEKACTIIAQEGRRVFSKGELVNLILLNWFYGGYLVSIRDNGRLDVLDIEIVNPETKLAIALSREEVEETLLPGFQWILLGYILRDSNWSMLRMFCIRNKLVSERDWCIIPGWRNSYLVVYREEDGLRKALDSINYYEVYRVKVDNNGLRHVVKID